MRAPFRKRMACGLRPLPYGRGSDWTKCPPFLSGARRAQQLGVNIEHVATVRQARRADEPDPVWAAVEAQLGGAACITFHLREDRRHIIDRDAVVLKEVVNVKLN